MNEKQIDYSIVIPVFDNVGSIKATFEQIRDRVMKKYSDLRCECIFVDDGSRDGSLRELIQLHSEYPKEVKIIKLSRNFGQVNAILAGYEFSRGKCIVNISADLQDPPELILLMLKAYFEEHYQIVICTRSARDESLYRRFTSRIFYLIIRELSFPDMPTGGFDFVLISDKVKEIILENREANAFFQGQVLWTGFKPKFIPYQRRKRENGRSRWTFSRKTTYLIDGVLGYSYFPLRLISAMGIVVSMLGILYAIVIFFARILGNIKIEGWAPIMIAMLVLAGLQMLMLGTIGEYLWRTLAQVKKRSPYIVEKIYDEETK